jgi:hypothetical protein
MFFLKVQWQINNNAKKSILKHCFDIDFAIDIAIIFFVLEKLFFPNNEAIIFIGNFSECWHSIVLKTTDS